MPLQAWIHHWEEGQGARTVKVILALLGFLALGALYDSLCYENFPSEEAMESAQLARHISEGKGFTTDSIRPVALYLLANAADPGQSSKVLAQPVPDLSTAPVYPCVLAGLMKLLPFQFTATQFWNYPPEQWIGVFNQVLFFALVLMLFFLARTLFDSKVAWLAAALLAGTRLFWRFTLSGLSTIWLMLIFLGIVWCLVTIERRDRTTKEEPVKDSILLAVLTGALAGIGTLSRYAFGWMIVPVILFVCLGATRRRLALGLTMAATFLVLVMPWLVRNASLSGRYFGTAGYAVAQGTPPFPHDTLERSADPRGGLTRLAPIDVVNKLMANGRDMCASDLPKFGGNWISAFFLVGLLIPFLNPGLQRLRWFMAGSFVLLFVVQALGRTHISDDSPEINSENMLVLLSPLVFMYGAALFHTLLDQLNLPPVDARGTVVSIFVVILCAPFLFGLMVPHYGDENSPYSPRHIQQTARFMQPNETMTSDIPSGVAWYGRRPCVWLPLDDENQFFKVNSLKPIRALFLTQVTTDQRYLSQMAEDEKSWGRFVLECAEHGEVPTGFPLRQAPAPRGFLPEQLFLSDKIRWQQRATKP